MGRLRISLGDCGLALCLAACSDSGNAPAPGGRFTFRESISSDLLRLAITNAAARTQAEELLQSGEARWAVGTPRRGDGGFNAPWPWHLDPATVAFAEVTAEACQTRASAVEDELDYWIGFGQVCIWGIVETRER
jgi:hypothetical protein